jgi:septal ring-binding cell division protein DamX
VGAGVDVRLGAQPQPGRVANTTGVSSTTVASRLSTAVTVAPVRNTRARRATGRPRAAPAMRRPAVATASGRPQGRTTAKARVTASSSAVVSASALGTARAYRAPLRCLAMRGGRRASSGLR